MSTISLSKSLNSIAQICNYLPKSSPNNNNNVKPNFETEINFCSIKLQTLHSLIKKIKEETSQKTLIVFQIYDDIIRDLIFSILKSEDLNYYSYLNNVTPNIANINLMLEDNFKVIIMNMSQVAKDFIAISKIGFDSIVFFDICLNISQQYDICKIISTLNRVNLSVFLLVTSNTVEELTLATSISPAFSNSNQFLLVESDTRTSTVQEQIDKIFATKKLLRELDDIPFILNNKIGISYRPISHLLSTDDSKFLGDKLQTLPDCEFADAKKIIFNPFHVQLFNSCNTLFFGVDQVQQQQEQYAGQASFSDL